MSSNFEVKFHTIDRDQYCESLRRFAVKTYAELKLATSDEAKIVPEEILSDVCIELCRLGETNFSQTMIGHDYIRDPAKLLFYCVGNNLYTHVAQIYRFYRRKLTDQHCMDAIDVGCKFDSLKGVKTLLYELPDQYFVRQKIRSIIDRNNYNCPDISKWLKSISEYDRTINLNIFRVVY